MFHNGLRLLFLLLACSLAPMLFAQANLTLESFGTFPQLAPGQLFTVDAYYSNAGPGAATNVTLTIAVPPGFQYEGYKAQSPLSCTEPPKDGHGNLVCTASSLGIVSWADLSATLRVDPAAAPGTVITLSATLTSSNGVNPSQTVSGSTTVLQPTNLRIEMSAPASVTLGGNTSAPPTTFPITFTVTNDGPATASFAELDVARQGGVSWSALTGPPGWRCGTSCTISSFPPGTATFTISATVFPDTTLTSVKEQAQAWSWSDPDFSDNSVTSTTTLVKPPKTTLALTMTAAPAVVTTGDQLTYTATITNTGNVDAQDVTFGWGLTGTPVATTCGTLTSPYCTLGTLAAGATLTETRTVRIDAGPGTLLDAGASVNASNVDHAPSQSAEVKTTVAGTPHADLGVTITPPNTTVLDNEYGNWLFEVTNAGPDPATDWQLTIPVPPNTTVNGVSVFPALYIVNPGTCDSLTPGATQITCHGTYLSGYKFQVTVNLHIGQGNFGPIHMTATVSPGTNVDPNPANNTAATDTTVFTRTYMGLTLTPDKTSAVVGDRITQTFTVTNFGPDPAVNPALFVTLPSTVRSVQVSSTFASCTGTAPIHCVSPTLAIGATLQATISFQTPPDPNSYESSAVVVWDNAGTGQGSAQTSTIFKVLPPTSGSDLSLSLSAPQTIHTGNDVLYTIQLRNLGTAPASNAAVQLPLPSSFALVSGPAECSGGAVVTCTAATLNSGAMATYFLYVRASAEGTFTTTATASTSSPDLNSANNSATATTVVTGPTPPPPADVTIAVVDISQRTLNVGDSVTFTMRVNNVGGSAAEGVVVTFNMPPSLTVINAPACTGNPVVTCAMGSLNSGDVAGFIVVARAGQPGTITSTANVSTSSPESNAVNNSAVATIVVNGSSTSGQADLQLGQVSVPSPLAAGVPFGFTIDIRNNGPSPASNFKLTITIPPGAQYDSYAADDQLGLTCTEPPKGGHGDLVCTAPSLGTIQFFPMEVDAHVDPAMPPGTVVTFPVTITSTNAIKPTQSNSGSVTVIPRADLHTEISAPASASPGATFPTTITVTNNGPAAAVGTEVRYSVKSGGGLAGAMTGPAGWTCGDGYCRNDSFAPGTATFTVQTWLPANLPAGTLVGKVYAISSSDPDTSDNILTASTVIAGPVSRKRAVHH